MEKLRKRVRELVRNIPRYYRAYGLRGMYCFAILRYSKRRRLRSMYFRSVKPRVWIRGDSTDIGVLKEIFLDREYELPISLNPKVIVDAGANIGLSSIYYAVKYPNATIYSLEPEKSNFYVLERNVKPYKNIIPIRVALWSESKHLQLLDPGRGKHGFVTEDGSSGAQTTFVESVQALSVVDLMIKYHIDFIDILKMDVEGAEKEIFESSNEWIGKVGLVVAELHERFKVGCSKAFMDATSNMTTIFERGKLIARMRPGFAGGGLSDGSD